MSIDVDVLIVGGGPAGLATAIELGRRGIRVLLAERDLRAGSAPRAKTTNVRTRTHLRRWGIADRLAAASPLGVDYPNDIMFVTRLGGYRLAHIKDAFNAAPARSAYYPEHAQWIPQYTFEKVLREYAATLKPVEMQFDATFLAAEQHEDSVTSVLRNAAGVERRITSRYVVGADGARSTVRSLIGASMIGTYGLSRNYNIVFRAPGLARAHPQGRAVQYWQTNRNGASLIGPMDRDEVWFFMPTGVPEGVRLSNEQAASAIATSTGIDLPYEIISTDEWVASRFLADRYRDGRIFLVGDACHLHPPFGGYGMNMGVSDAVDIGWKLAAQLQGWGGPQLLNSYEIERRQIHAAVIDEAVANHAVLGNQLWQEGLEDDTPSGEALRQAMGERIMAVKTREFHTLGTVLGLSIEDSPLIAYDGSAPPVRNGQSYRPSARPGSLAPHAWLADGRSLYDLFGEGFTLIASADAEDRQVDLIATEARELGVPLEIIKPEETSSEISVRTLYAATLALVRPDQHVAWRGDHWAAQTLQKAIGR